MLVFLIIMDFFLWCTIPQPSFRVLIDELWLVLHEPDGAGSLNFGRDLIIVVVKV